MTGKRATGVAFGALFATSGVLWSSPVGACGGPCDVGDVWSATWVGQELNVVTNFGLLRRRDTGWHLDCEEVMGDKLTGAHFSPQVQVALTASGFLVREPGICSWRSHIDGASNTWLLGFALVPTLEADAGAMEPELLGLVIDRSTSDSKVERARLGGAFETLETFSWELGIDRMVAGGEPLRVYVTGYSFPPRTWHVRWADLGGGAHADAAADAAAQRGTVTFSGSDLEREGELAELRPLAVDPRDSSRLWLRAAVTTQDPDALFAFEADEETLTRVFTLERREKLADLAFSGERVYVAGRDDGVSVVYAARLDSLEFEPVAQLDATLTCLEVDGDRWLACNSDFTRESPFIVATSEDGGESWQPELEIADLVTLTSCGSICAATTGWLYGVYGASQPGPATPAGPDLDASSSGPNASRDAGAGDEGGSGGSDGCDCRVQGGAPRSTATALGVLVLVLGWRRASTPKARPLHYGK